jgi:hypothetical protein
MAALNGVVLHFVRLCCSFPGLCIIGHGIFVRRSCFQRCHREESHEVDEFLKGMSISLGRVVELRCTPCKSHAIELRIPKIQVVLKESKQIWSAPGGVGCWTLVKEYEYIACTRETWIQEAQQLERKLAICPYAVECPRDEMEDAMIARALDMAE